MSNPDGQAELHNRILGALDGTHEARDHADRLLSQAVAALDAAYGPDESPVSVWWAADRGDCRVHYASEAEARQNAGEHPVVRGGIVTLPWVRADAREVTS